MLRDNKKTVVTRHANADGASLLIGEHMAINKIIMAD